MPPGKKKRSVSGASDTSEFTKHESQAVEGECLARSPDHSAERKCARAKGVGLAERASANPEGALRRSKLARCFEIFAAVSETQAENSAYKQ